MKRAAVLEDQYMYLVQRYCTERYLLCWFLKIFTVAKVGCDAGMRRNVWRWGSFVLSRRIVSERFCHWRLNPTTKTRSPLHLSVHSITAFYLQPTKVHTQTRIIYEVKFFSFELIFNAIISPLPQSPREENFISTKRN